MKKCKTITLYLKQLLNYLNLFNTINTTHKNLLFFIKIFLWCFINIKKKEKSSSTIDLKYYWICPILNKINLQPKRIKIINQKVDLWINPELEFLEILPSKINKIKNIKILHFKEMFLMILTSVKSQL